MTPVFSVILEAPKSGDHYYDVYSYEEAINLINFAKENGQRIKKITQAKKGIRTLEEIKKGGK